MVDEVIWKCSHGQGYMYRRVEVAMNRELDDFMEQPVDDTYTRKTYAGDGPDRAWNRDWQCYLETDTGLRKRIMDDMKANGGE